MFVFAITFINSWDLLAHIAARHQTPIFGGNEAPEVPLLGQSDHVMDYEDYDDTRTSLAVWHENYPFGKGRGEHFNEHNTLITVMAYPRISLVLKQENYSLESCLLLFVFSFFYSFFPSKWKRWP